MQSLSEALITSKQAKEILSNIEDESDEAEFIGKIIVCLSFAHFALHANCGRTLFVTA
jgi:hypothetical protein